jgi:hypothetical protein
MTDGAIDVPDLTVELATSRSHDFLKVGEAERNEEKPRLVDVTIILVDDGDLGLILQKETPQPVRRQGPARSATQDHNAMRHRSQSTPW